MKKALFIISSIFSGLSLLGVYICVVLEKTFPILGKMAAQFSVDNRYDIQAYTLDLDAVIIGCCILFVCSLILACWAFISELKHK